MTSMVVSDADSDPIITSISFGEARAEAEVWSATAERDMRVRRLLDVEAIRIGEHRVVPVR